ncbi:hypothetical protein JOC70_002664 [Clostridium pascui]|uniref:DUF3298 and DUF4163 domain-containing protein n=1 Tax=Clostridium pascui TaxID=46609 RepID=UPI00195D4474|nr:DUF3298 and DUF4163 domain-containing protein [Clostridium pascui]MBM7871166.1 hypothetical protein [Clostridium pascui]
MKKSLFVFSVLVLTLLSFIINIIYPVNAHSAKLKSNSMFLYDINNITISTTKINYKEDYIEVDLNIPTLNNLKDKNIQDKINKYILNSIYDLKNKIEKLAKTDMDNNILTSPYNVQTNYDVHYANASFLSLTIMYYEYTGGAHGISYKLPYNLNLKTGENVTLEKLFKPTTNYIDLINKEIQLQIDKKNSVPGAIPITEFKTISNTQPFYIDGSNLVIYFQPYEIGPYVLGIQEFTIPLRKLRYF